jgi:ribosome maturation factor RimP
MGGFFQPIFFGCLAKGGKLPGGGCGTRARFGLWGRGRSLLQGESVDGSMAGVPVPGGSGHACIERTVVGLGFEVVDVERSARGLLRVYIDRVPGRVYPEAQGPGEFVTVDDCEVVTRQLQYVLEVEGVPYERLEVSSPGLDRPLKKAADYERFCGQAIELTLRQPYQGRKHWRGVLGRGGAGYVLALGDERAGTELAFTLDEVREARLVPVIDFKGRGRAARPAG